jgi:hypothetical protein
MTEEELAVKTQELIDLIDECLAILEKAATR